MQKFLISLVILPLFAIALAGCKDDEDIENMIWELVSNSDSEMIEVSIDTNGDFSSPANIWVNAGYKSGDIELRCMNHPLSRTLSGSDDTYINQEMGFTISKVDDYTLRIHFVEDASGKQEMTDQITITNSDRGPLVCNTFLWITRSFGELQPEPEGFPDKYKFSLAKSGLIPFMQDNFTVPAPFDNISFEIRDHLDTYIPFGFPEFLEPYDSIVWSAKGMPDTYRIYERNSTSEMTERHFTPKWSTNFFKPGALMSYVRGYSDGKVIYSDSLRTETHERDFLCFDWKKGSVNIANPRTTGMFCLLDRSREYNVVDTRAIDGTRYSEIYVWNHKYLPDDKFLSFSKNALISLMKENIGEGKSAVGNTDMFKCIPDGVVAERIWENKTTRIVLLHELPTDDSLEGYYLLVEAK